MQLYRSKPGPPFTPAQPAGHRTRGRSFNFLALLVLLAPVVGTCREESESRFLSNTRQLIYEGRRSGEGYFSPDGQRLVFQSEREPGNPFYQIYTLDLATGDSRRVSPGHGKTTCAFFRPSSDDILFASTHLDPSSLQKQKEELEFRASGKARRYSWDYDPAMDIFAARHDGTHLRNLTSAPGYDAEGAYSPDGSKIVFCSLRDAYPPEKLSPADRKRLEVDPSWFGEIYIMEADGSAPRRLTHQPGYDGGPFFSADGQRIIWRRFDEKGVNADIYTMKLDGSDVRRLTDFAAMSWAPYLHPSGRYAVFTANKLGFDNFELFLVDELGKKEPVRVTYTDGFDGLPVFSPDGAKLCWTSNRTADKQSQLFLASWNHEAALQAIASAPARSSLPPAQPGGEGHGHPHAAPVAEDPGSRSGPAISENDLRRHINRLTADEMNGRAAGSPGSSKASAYLSKELNQLGIKGPGGGEDHIQNFEFTASNQVMPGANHLRFTRPDGSITRFEAGKDFLPLSFSSSASVTGQVVFAGYGLVVPGKLGEGYDSYSGLNVSNKIVLVLRYAPENVEPKRRQELNRYAALRYKAMMARERGAIGLLIVTGPNSPNPGELSKMASDGSLSGSGIPAVTVGTNAAEILLASQGRSLSVLQGALDIENPHAEGAVALTNLTVSLTTAVRPIKKPDQNVIGVIPPTGGERTYVMLGAHYDHLGRGDHNSLQHKHEENGIHHGADDNASGVAAVLEIAEATAAARPDGLPRRGVLFAFWGAEEQGLLGSAHFAERPPVPLSNIVAYVNFDMVGRLRENKLSLQGIGSSPEWRKIIEKRNVAAGFNLALQEDPYLPTDVNSFYPKGVPVLSFFSGSHEDYHRPTDTADKINYEGLQRIAQFARNIASELMDPAFKPTYAKVERSAAGGGGSRDGLRAYLGTIPDYATEVKGVKLTGARGGSPADKAGLTSGDIIVEFAGQKIENIYDYTYALEAVKIGVPVEVTVERGGRRLKISVTPEARK